VLEAVAGDKSPKQPSDCDTPKAKRNYRQEWEAWWKDASEKADLKKVDFEEASRNYTLVGLYGYTDKKQYTGRVLEMDKDGKEKWKMDGLLYPVYACKTKRDRILVAEHNGNKVTERDTKIDDVNKNIVWKKENVSQPLACERLPNGNTLIVARNEMLEVDGKGNTVRSVNRNGNYDIVTAGRHKDGSYTLITTNTTIIRYDASFKQLNSVSLNRYLSYTTGLKCSYLPKGGLVLPDYGSQMLREYDADGKELTTIKATYPTAVTKLTNGNYVYLSRAGNQGIHEIDAKGNSVSTKTIPNSNNRMTPMFMERK